MSEFSVLLGCAFPAYLSGESRLVRAFLSAPTGDCQLFHLQSWDVCGKSKPSGLPSTSLLRSQVPCCLLSVFQIWLLFALCIMCRELYLAEERGKSMSAPSSQSRSADSQDLILEILLSMNERYFLDINLI